MDVLLGTRLFPANLLSPKNADVLLENADVYRNWECVLKRVTYNGKESYAGQSLDGFATGIVFLAALL
jgi:hypothetical protein